MTVLRIAVADDEPDMREFFQKGLPRLGHSVVAAARDGRELIEQCRATQPDLVITDIQMPDMDGIDAAAQVCREQSVPVILVSAFADPGLIARAGADHILGYLVKPIRQADLGPAIALAMRRFAEFEALRREAADPRQALADRKVIEKARGVLMKRAALDEPDAFRRLQTLASEKSRMLVEIAQTILASEEAIRPPELG